MTKNKRFELLSFHFHDLQAVIYDNLEEKRLHLSIYEIIELLNNVSKQEYDLEKFGKEINDKLDEMIGVVR